MQSTVITSWLRRSTPTPQQFYRFCTSTSVNSSKISDANNNNTDNFDYDFFVIGAGPGGIASARRAASYGAKVAIAERRSSLGGTCVNVGSVPKKVLYNAATIAETVHGMEHYGFSGFDNITFDWQFLQRAREAYIQRLHDIYQMNLRTSRVDQFIGTKARLVGPQQVSLTNEAATAPTTTTIRARHILIATGGRPMLPSSSSSGIREHAITSDEFFTTLNEQPGKAVIIGGGYVAVELAGALQALGTATTLAMRNDMPLSSGRRCFDSLLSETLDREMQLQGIEILRNTEGLADVQLADADSGLKRVLLQNGDRVEDVDTVIVATGRTPNVEELGLETVGVQQDDRGYIQVNEYSETNVEDIFSVGDVIGEAVELTPTAIAAGRRVADRLFGGERYREAKVSYESVPTVVFSHPPIGTIGMTEQEAISSFGNDNVRVFRSKFPNLYFGPWQVDAVHKPKTAMKLVCVGPNELIVGLHVIGMGADEMVQGFSVALKMGATKADFDATVAVHPTAAQEFVTMFPWGRAPA